MLPIGKPEVHKRISLWPSLAISQTNIGGSHNQLGYVLCRPPCFKGLGIVIGAVDFCDGVLMRQTDSLFDS